MREHSDDLELTSCLRHARRGTIALLCMLAINGSLVALAFGGFGATARREPMPQATAPSVPAVAPAVAIESPAHSAAAAQPPQVEPDVASLPVTIADPPPTVVDVPASDPPAVTNPPPSPAVVQSPPAVTPPQSVPPVSLPPVSVPPDNVVPPPASDSLIVANPPEIGGPVHFTVNGAVYTLAPGEYVELAGRRQRLVEFHRGDDFGYAAHQLETGLHSFDVCPTGWSLKPLEAAAARQLLNTCRAKRASP